MRAVVSIGRVVRMLSVPESRRHAETAHSTYPSTPAVTGQVPELPILARMVVDWRTPSRVEVLRQSVTGEVSFASG